MISLIHFTEEDSGNSLGDMVYRQLRDSIINGELLPGDRLMELKLAEQMGVSRTPVRDAIRRLEREDLVITEKDRGARVAPIDPKDVADATEMRKAIGTMCVRMAVNNINSDDLKKMNEANEVFREAAENGDVRGLSLADNDFHRCICDATGSKILLDVIDTLEQKVTRYKFEYLRMANDYDEIYNEHKLLVKTLSEGNAKEAEEIMVAHVSRQNKIVE